MREPATNRRWFQWSLGTMLIATAICGWAMLEWPWLVATPQPMPVSDWMAGKEPPVEYTANPGVVWPASAFVLFLGGGFSDAKRRACSMAQFRRMVERSAANSIGSFDFERPTRQMGPPPPTIWIAARVQLPLSSRTRTVLSQLPIANCLPSGAKSTETFLCNATASLSAITLPDKSTTVRFRLVPVKAI